MIVGNKSRRIILNKYTSTMYGKVITSRKKIYYSRKNGNHILNRVELEKFIINKKI